MGGEGGFQGGIKKAPEGAKSLKGFQCEGLGLYVRHLKDRCSRHGHLTLCT